ncbi:MAG: hypothetical protein DMF09_14030 [Verrucomicrobia bacterium]|nr:MAG: hypothetical protein DMF09_14030 [Verrucomicrobiota bacterium]
MQVPITTNNDAHSRYVSPFLEKNYAGFGTSPKISAVFFADARAAIFVPRGRGATTNSFV